jgi:hypothetical protein
MHLLKPLDPWLLCSPSASCIVPASTQCQLLLSWECLHGLVPVLKLLPPRYPAQVPDPTDPAWSGGAGLHEGASSFGGHHTPGHGETPRVDARGSAGGAAGASALLGTQQGTHVGGRPEPGAAGVGSSQRHYR